VFLAPLLTAGSMACLLLFVFVADGHTDDGRGAFCVSEVGPLPNVCLYRGLSLRSADALESNNAGDRAFYSFSQRRSNCCTELTSKCGRSHGVMA
jgi:hypothetical protein